MPQNIGDIDFPCIERGPQALYNESGHDIDLEALYIRILRLYREIGEHDSEVCILLVTDEAIREANKEWRNVDEATDVLSFPMREGEENEKFVAQLPLGDIVVSVPTAKRYAQSGNHLERLRETDHEAAVDVPWDLLNEITFLIIHGTLHLLGMDHAEPEEERAMRVKEAELMRLILSER